MENQHGYDYTKQTQPVPAGSGPIVPVKENKRKNRGPAVAALFMVGLLLAGVLAWAGVSMSERQAQNRVQAAALPAIALQDPPEDAGLTTHEIVTKVVPSVVSIELYGRNSLEPEGYGSGIVFSADGYIVTNAHVVEGADAIRVLLWNDEGYTARLAGTDTRNDLAVVKIEASGLTPAEFANSDNVMIGEKVVAIGNAAGIFPGSPTQGIISGVNRELPMETSTGGIVRRTLLQTDAAINPGNSGGALVNAHGQVIGVNVAKLYSIEIDNIGFAIPSNVVNEVVASLRDEGEMPQTPLLGVTVLALNETNGPPNGLPEKGLYIESIRQESDLYLEDVDTGDVILKAGGREMVETDDLTRMIAGMKPGDKLELKVYRPKTDDTVTVEATLFLLAENEE